jgi:hypothetical protein
MRRVLGLAVAAWLLLPADRPRAAELTDVASSFDDHNRFDFRFRMRYDHTEKRAQIKREVQGLSATQDTNLLFKDLLYEQYRDQLTLRAEIGLYHDLSIDFELPIIIEEAASYSLDNSAGSACVFPPQMNPNCVNDTNSTTIRDGIVPAAGYDARNNGVALPGGLFRSVLRGARGGSGADAFDTFNVGLNWAPLSQARDDTKPTWLVSVQGQFSIGNVKAFDRASPDANHGVSDGTHRLFIRTAISKRYKFLDPYWDLWYLLSIPRGDSLFVDYGRQQKTKNPQMRGGVTAGVEVVPIDKQEKQYKLAFDLRGRVTGVFGGRGYSEVWELLAGSPALACDMAMQSYNPACNAGATTNPYQLRPFTGITTIENYAQLGAAISVVAQIGPYLHVRTGFEYQHDRAHDITGDDIGTPASGSGRVTQPNEFNPAYRPVIDQPGRRYRVDNVNTFNFYLLAQIMF